MAESSTLVGGALRFGTRCLYSGRQIRTAAFHTVLPRAISSRALNGSASLVFRILASLLLSYRKKLRSHRIHVR
jgi:hypothetical protein